MRRPESMIRLHILRQTPIGTCIEEAYEIIKNNERWGTPEIDRDMGFIHRNPMNYGLGSGEVIIGEMRIQSRPEKYNVPLFHERGIQIFWGFDENGRLIEVHVHTAILPRLV